MTGSFSESTVPYTRTMPFKEFDIQRLHSTFSLQRVDQLDVLDEWLSHPAPVSPEESRQLENWRRQIDRYAESWNEEEMKWYFISKIMDLVDFNTEHFHFFLDRTLEGQVDDILLRGRVDAVIAAGEYAPEAPYFCFHEYTRERTGSDDPRAQVLVAMLAAQGINKNALPVYGIYTVGRMWFFLVLKGRVYAVNVGTLASQPEGIHDILRHLKSLKTILLMNYTSKKA